MLDFPDCGCIWDRTKFSLAFRFDRVGNVMSGWKPSKIQIKEPFSGTFQTQSQDDDGVWPLIYSLLIMWKKLGKAEGVENRISHTCLHGVFIFSRLLSEAEDFPSRPCYSSLSRGQAKPGLWCAFGSWRYQHPRESAAPSNAARSVGSFVIKGGVTQVLTWESCLPPSCSWAENTKPWNKLDWKFPHCVF